MFKDIIDEAVFLHKRVEMAKELVKKRESELKITIDKLSPEQFFKFGEKIGYIEPKDQKDIVDEYLGEEYDMYDFPGI